MKMRTLAAIIAGIGMSATASAQLDLGTLGNGFTAGFLTYGNANIYSLPVNNYVHDYYFGGGTGPGSPYYVRSTPGAIKDTVVIYTGASGKDVTTNAAGFENSYQAPSGVQGIYADTLPTNMIAPSAKANAAENPTTMFANTWDADVGALNTFLDGGLATFLFNNNETRGDQNLAFWAKLWITDENGADFLFSNGVKYLYANRTPAALYGTPGIPSGDPTAALAQNENPTITAGVGGLPPTTDWIMSGGDVCIDDTAGPAAPGYPSGTPAIVPCTNAGVDEVIPHNLGADQVAYAAQFPLLDMALLTLGAGATLHVDLRIGCDPRWTTITGASCDQLGIDNGFEQLFLISTKTPTLDPEPEPVPEPGILALVGAGLLGVAYSRRRKANAQA